MRIVIPVVLMMFAACAREARGQAGAGSPPASPAAPAHGKAATPNSAPGDSTSSEAYYFFSLGHLNELEFEATGRSDLAEQSIDNYRKALEIAPSSPVIMERLAEILAKSQHIRDAVAEANETLKIDPDNVDAHRLLARIYVRTLGDVNAGDMQTANLAKAVDQLQAIMKLDPTDENSALWLARLYRFQNHHEEAEKVLRDLLKRDPDNEAALEQLSQILIDEGRSQEAVALLEQAANDSSAPEVYDLLGDAYSQSKNYAKAEETYRKAVAADPDDAGHRHGLAQVLLAENKYAEALEQYQKLAELEPGTSENYLRMSQLYRHLGKFDQAESSLLRAKQLAPGSLEVLYNESLLYQDMGRYDDAIKVLNDAIASVKSQNGEEPNPSALAILYEQLGRAYSQQGNYTAAIQSYELLAKLNPETEKRAQMLLIEAYRESHDVDGAIAEAKKALSASPKDSDVTVTLAMLYGEKGDAEEASKLLSGLLRGDSHDHEIYLDLAQVQERSRKYGEAEQSANKALETAQLPQEKGAAYFMLGAIYERQKKFDQAEQQFRKALEVNPDNAAVLNYYGYMLADRGIRLPEATALIQRALEQDPVNGAYLDSLGWAYYKQNKLTEAEENLRKAVSRDQHDPTILGHLADVCMKLGETTRAAGLYERALAEWQKAVPADYEAEKVAEIDAQLKILKRRLAEKPATDAPKPQ
jgi:tetratricopeptide (TPR) repeat protein